MKKIICCLMICVIIFTNTTDTYAAATTTVVTGVSLVELLKDLCLVVAAGAGVAYSADKLSAIYDEYASNNSAAIDTIAAKQINAKLFDSEKNQKPNKNSKAFAGVLLDTKVMNYVQGYIDEVIAQADIDDITYSEFTVSSKFFNKYIAGVNPDFDWLEGANKTAAGKNTSWLPVFCFKDENGIWNVYYELYDDMTFYYTIDISGTKYINHDPTRYRSYYYDMYLVTYNPETELYGSSPIYRNYNSPYAINDACSNFYWLIPDTRTKCKLKLTVANDSTVFYYASNVITTNNYAGTVDAIIAGLKNVSSTNSVGKLLNTDARSLSQQALEALQELANSKTTVAEDGTVTSDMVLTAKALAEISSKLNELNKSIAAGSSTVTSSDTYVTEVTNIYNSYSNSYEADYGDILSSITSTTTDLLTAVLELPSRIAEAIRVFFIPSEEAIANTLALFQAKLPWIDIVKDYSKTLHSALLNTDDTFEPVIYIELGNTDKNYSTINYGGRAVALDLRWYKAYKAQVDEIISALMWLVFLWELFKKIPGIINGSSMVMTKTVEISQYGINEAGDVR